MRGTIEPADLPVLQAWVPMINGEQAWVAPQMDVLGVIQGDLEGIADGFSWVAAAAPSLTATVQLSPTWEDRGVDLTITIARGAAVLGSPVVDQLRQETDAERAARLASGWETSDAMRWP